MFYHRRRGWEIPTRETTPEALFLDRRAFTAGLGAVALGAGMSGAWAEEADGTAALYPAKRNEAYKLDREVTPEKINLNYNNFYEYSTDKKLSADALRVRRTTSRRWSVR